MDRHDTPDTLSIYGLDAEAREHVAEAGALLLPHLDRILDQFYAYVGSVPAMAAMFRDPEMMAHARAAQKAHWTLMLKGTFGDDYRASVQRIGRVHFRIGLDMNWYAGNYARFASQLQAILAEAVANRLGRARISRLTPLLSALTRTLFLDLGMAVDAFHAAQQEDFTDRLHRLGTEFEAQVGKITETVASAATQLSAAAQGMSARTETATGEATRTIQVAADAAAKVLSVSSAAEELSASIHAITGQVTDASRISARAAEKAQRTDDLVQALRASGDEIGGVVDLISDIASQTNLLALNASVEAARAGEAGKGFAVVASEVKHLSMRISDATNDISAKIHQMQKDTADAVSSLHEIGETIRQMATISTAIATSVEEQRHATDEIATNAEATATITDRMTHSIESVGGTIRDTGTTAGEVLGAARALSTQSDALSSQVGRFLAGLRVA
ncbi:methyl-accepting chemotaxis protein [Pseudooceanicola sp. LIPI14-2-Ac024]|uniref:methyl-accepting chemotaxis protein n=1 Tax=Pseudooceanicola sp. LIPI14-2-Ac024 TaxID=3344875 RepID=UPI0035D0A454